VLGPFLCDEKVAARTNRQILILSRRRWVHHENKRVQNG